jgi:hypothetical protein
MTLEEDKDDSTSKPESKEESENEDARPDEENEADQVEERVKKPAPVRQQQTQVIFLIK